LSAIVDKEPMKRLRNYVYRLILPLVAAAASLLPARAAGQAADDGVPTGMVAFFTGTSCPTGWSAADYTNGRLVVGVNFAERVGKTVGNALADKEDRAHNHPFTIQLNPSVHSVSGSDGGNNQGAAAQTYSVSDATAPATSGLPFIQLLVCEKQ
jgi:hypothetical protein